MSRGAAGALGRNEWRQNYWEIGEFYILRRADLRPGEIEVRVSIEYYLDRWLSDPLITSRLLDVHRHLLGNWGDLAPTGDEHDHRERLRRELLDAFQRGLLALVSRVWRVGGAGGLGEDAREAQTRKWANAGPPQQSSSPEAKPVKTWVEFRLVDKEKRPVAGANYKLTTTDGSTRVGTLDEDGSVRVAGIDPGTCQISFPDYDGREWKRA